MTPIIDFHIHVSGSQHRLPSVMHELTHLMQRSPDEVAAHLDGILHPDKMPGYLADNQLDYAVLLAENNPVVTGVADNDYTASFARQANAHVEKAGGTRLLAFCTVNPTNTFDMPGELERCIAELGCVGLKLYPPYQFVTGNDARLYPLYAKAQQLGIPVMIHTGTSVFKGARLKYGDPMLMDDVAVDFPDLPIILAHSGRGLWYDTAFMMARIHDNVYLEVSGLPPHRLLDYFPALESLADKVIFGTDWPGLPATILDNVNAIRALPLGDESAAAILGGNAARLLKLDG